MKRALIVAQGLERERIMAAVSQHSPNKLIILRSVTDVSQELSRSVGKHIETLRKELLPPDGRNRSFPFLLEIDDTEKVDFFDLASAIAEIDTRVKEELKSGYEVSVDLSSGNKIVCIALHLVAQLHGLRTTYCSAGRYASMKEEEPVETETEQIAFSVSKNYEIPRLPLRLDKIPTDILMTLESMGGTAESIKVIAEKANPGRRIDKSLVVETSRKIEMLETYGYVFRKRIGRKLAVEVTESGRLVTALHCVIANKKQR